MSSLFQDTEKVGPYFPFYCVRVWPPPEPDKTEMKACGLRCFKDKMLKVLPSVFFSFHLASLGWQTHLGQEARYTLKGWQTIAGRMETNHHSYSHSHPQKMYDPLLTEHACFGVVAGSWNTAKNPHKHINNMQTPHRTGARIWTPQHWNISCYRTWMDGW